METKKCRGCAKELPLSEFYWLGPKKNRHDTRCKECVKVYRSRNYQKHREKYVAYSTMYATKRYRKFQELKNGPCIDCDQTFHPAAMHWHHLEEFTKVDCVSNLWRNKKALEEELKKCVLICANCHAIRTWNTKDHKEQQVGI